MPSNYDISPLWYLTVKVIYFDEELGQDQERTWLAFDPDFYTVAQLNGSSALACEARRLKLFNVQMNPQFTIIADEGLNQQGRAQLNVQASMNVVGEKTILENFSATLSSSFTQTAVSGRIRSNVIVMNSQAISSTSFIRILDLRTALNSSFTQTAVLTDAPFEYGIQGLGGYTIPSITGTGLIIDWGDGTQTTQFDAVTPTSRSKSYPGTSQQYTIKITGNLTSIRLGNDGLNSHRIRGVTRFNNSLQSFSMQHTNTNQFAVVEDLFTFAPTQIPRSLTNLNYAFWQCNKFNQAISAWNTSNIADKRDMFSFRNPGTAYAAIYNHPLNTWNTSSVTNMQNMFRGQRSFNQPLNNWNTGNVTNMSRMFEEARVFNQALNTWNTSSVTNMSNMFFDARAFNQPLNNWNQHG